MTILRKKTVFLSIQVENLLIYLYGQRYYICGDTIEKPLTSMPAGSLQRACFSGCRLTASMSTTKYE